jgi:hypothetical protein
MLALWQMVIEYESGRSLRGATAMCCEDFFYNVTE